MKKWITSVLVLTLLMGLTGCKEVHNDNKSAPELLEPVGVQMDIAKAEIGDIFKVTTYNGMIIPYVEELQFVIDGNLEEMKVSLGELVKEGQVLADLSVEAVTERMEELQEEIADIEIRGGFSDRQMAADIDIAKAELERLEKNGASGQAIRLKEIDIIKLEKGLEQAAELRQLEIQEKQREWKALKEKTKNNEIKAPFDGRVVYIRNMESGAAINGYTTVICLADESRLRLDTEYLSESAVNNAYKVYAKVGEKEYDLEYLPMETNDYITKILNGEEVRTQFLVDADDGELESGQFAVVMIINGYKDNVLTIPVNALYQDAGSRYVYKMSDGKRIRCDVSVGSVNSTKVEITEGLEEGDLVYVKE